MNKKTLLFTLALAAICLLAQFWVARASLTLPLTLSFNQDLPKGAVLAGFGPREDWGRWTVAKTAQIYFVSALNEPVTVQLTAKAFGPNVAAPIEVECGAQKAILTFGAEAESKEISCGAGVGFLGIVIPKPTSPQALGLSPDGRSLGLGIIALAIKPGGLPRE